MFPQAGGRGGPRASHLAKLWSQEDFLLHQSGNLCIDSDNNELPPVHRDLKYGGEGEGVCLQLPIPTMLGELPLHQV